MGEPLRTLPYAQTYAWVEPSKLWLGTLPRDDLMGDRSFVKQLKARIEVSFRALDWAEVDDSLARYHVSILLGERTFIRSEGIMTPRQPGVVPSMSGSSIYRGIAIRRLSDGAIFWHLLWTGDQWNNAEILGNLIAELALGRAPVSESE